MGASSVALALAALPLAGAGDRWWVLVALAVAGILAAAVALAWRVAATWWAVAAFSAEYVGSLVGRNGVDARAPVVGAGLLALAELILWSHDLRSPAAIESEIVRRRLVGLGALVLCSLLVGSLVLGGSFGGNGRIELEIAGVVAACAILGLIVALARRERGTADVQPDGSGRTGA